MSNWVICCDFDGTICIPDSSEYLLARFALPGWQEMDDAVWRGELTEREMFKRQVDLLRVSWPEAQAALHDGVRIREGFSEFVQFCRERRMPLVILSSGLRELIDELLGMVGASDLDIRSHHTQIEGNRWTLIPWEGRRLAEHCSHCKCDYLVQAREAGKRIAYIGDGFTDLCPIERADLVFATGKLAEVCRKAGRAFYPFETFFEIGRKLEELFQLEQDHRS